MNANQSNNDEMIDKTHANDGFDAARAGKPETANPWKPGTLGHSTWALGWQAGKLQNKEPASIGRYIGERIARTLEAVFPKIGDDVRAYYAQKFGVCRECKRPLGGHSQENICEPCHAAEVLAEGLGGSKGGDA